MNYIKVKKAIQVIYLGFFGLCMFSLVLSAYLNKDYYMFLFNIILSLIAILSIDSIHKYTDEKNKQRSDK